MTKRTMPVLTTKEFGIKIVTRIDYKGHTVRLASTSEIPEIENTFRQSRGVSPSVAVSKGLISVKSQKPFPAKTQSQW